MSCIPEPVVFRLLDGIVGWDVRSAVGLDGLDDAAAGIVLATTSPDAVDPASLLPWLPPARLAPGCGRCAWWLVTPVPSRLLRLSCGARPGPSFPWTACPTWSPASPWPRDGTSSR